MSLPRIVTAAAFDLVSTSQGAVLAFAPAREQGGGIVLLTLDPLGAPRGRPRRIVDNDPAYEVHELALSASARRATLVWVEAGDKGSRTRALVVALDAGGSAQPSLVASSTEPAAIGARGRIATATLGNGRTRILYTAGRTPCVDGAQGPCVGFGFRDLEEPPPARQEPWLSVPEPCARGAVAVGSLDGRWYYAVCSAAHSREATTVYSINLETAYARADQVLEGCNLLSMTAIDAATLLLGAECGATRRAARLTLDMEPATEVALEDVGVACDGERATLRATGWGLPLDTPHDRLEAILPSTLAPSGSRAVSTGHALLVAQPASKGLALFRHACQRGALRAEPISVP